MNQPTGNWIKIHRSLMDSAVWADDWLVRLWLWCLLKANYTDSNWHGVTVLRGQFITGRSTAADELGVSPSRWYRGIDELVKLGNISVEANRHWTKITVCNYCTYQATDADTRTAVEQQMNNERTANEQQVNTSKNVRREEDIHTPTPARGPELEPATATQSLRTWKYPEKAPECVCRAIDSWQEHIQHKNGRPDSDIALVMAYKHARDAGWDDAKIVASVEFSIAKKANTWLNPDNNFQAPPAPRSGAAARRRHNSTPF